MLRTMLGIVVAVSLMSSAWSADAENPFKKAKVGDWVEYKIVNKAGGMNMDGSQKQTVTAKTDEECTVEVAMKMMGQEMKSSYTVKLNEKFDPMKQPGMDATVKELGTGEDKVTIDGKELNTKWVEAEVVTKAGGQEMKIKTKAWTSTEVPLGGLVKMDSDMGAMGKMNMELTKFGSGK